MEPVGIDMNVYRFSNSSKIVSAFAVGIIASTCFAGMPKTSEQPEGSVLKVKLDNKLESKTAKVGDKFTATLDTGKQPDYFGLPKGTKVEGHVSAARARQGKTAGQLELSADTLVLANGERFPIEATTMKIDKRSVTNDKGRLMAAPAYRHTSTNYVATGAAVGVVAAAITGGDLLAGGILGAAIGFLIGQSHNNTYAQDVTLKQGTTFGVRFNKDTTITFE
ncbi:MAG: hypothetical protein GC165_06580 [Armatimonadetes bacterium]|nr:hypothetical protein [Armatimonadota bacterium]